MANDPQPDADRNSTFDFAKWGFRPRIQYQNPRLPERIEKLLKKARRGR